MAAPDRFVKTGLKLTVTEAQQRALTKLNTKMVSYFFSYTQ